MLNGARRGRSAPPLAPPRHNPRHREPIRRVKGTKNWIAAANLKTELDAVLQRVRDDGEQFEIVQDGHEVARIIPAPRPTTGAQFHYAPAVVTEEERARLIGPIKQTPEQHAKRMAQLDELIKEIGRHTHADAPPFDATDDLRRDL